MIKIMNQSQIDRICFQYKKWYLEHFPLCGFCFHRVKEGEADLTHIIRRSYSREMQMVKLNCCLAHRDCYQIWDDNPEQAVYLPRIIEILYIVYLLDEKFFNLIAGNFVTISDILQLFPGVENREITHHGQLLQLTYLYS